MKLCLLLLLGTVPAWADSDPHRRVALLEYRGATLEAPGLAERAEKILRSDSSLSVMGPDDVRRIAGARLDQEIARCAGKPACVAGLGAKVSASEVILIGVSEFGDLIVTLQRIDVASLRVLGRVADALPKGSHPDDKLLNSYLRRLLPPSDFQGHGQILVKTNVSDAALEIDGVMQGLLPRDAVMVSAPATHDVLVSKPGFMDFRARIDVKMDASVELSASLSRREDRAWYRKWWVWAIAGGVATASGVGIVLANQPKATHVPVTVELPRP